MNPPEAAQLLQSTQRMRVAWTAFIGSLIGYAGALFVGLWAFLLKAYIDASRAQDCQQSSPDSINYILIASASSSVVLGLWRLLTRHLDAGIARLYPTLVYCEQVMEVPMEYGTVAYLSHSVFENFQGSLPAEKKIILQGVQTLVNSKRIGNRRHGIIDLLAMAVILVQAALCLTVYIHQVGAEQRSALVVAIAFIAFSAMLVLLALTRYQRNPSKQDVTLAFRSSSDSR